MRAGETNGGAHSSGNGKGICIIDVTGEMAPICGDTELALGAGGEKVVIGI